MTLVELAKQLRPIIEQAAATLSDATALQGVQLFPMWKPGLSVSVDERYQYNNVLYRVVQAHTTQADWTPDKTPALFVVVSLDEWPEFVQPTGAHDAYHKGDKITYKGKRYICTAADGVAVVWDPDTYPDYWKEVEV